MSDRLYNHILGSLATAGLGDALGAATEQWSTAEIYEAHGGPLRTLIKPSPDTFSGAEGNDLGQITDDTSQMFYLAETIIEVDGNLTNEAWVQCLLRWADQSPHVGNMGPTTRLVVEALRTGGDPYKVGVVGYLRPTNGRHGGHQRLRYESRPGRFGQPRQHRRGLSGCPNHLSTLPQHPNCDLRRLRHCGRLCPRTHQRGRCLLGGAGLFGRGSPGGGVGG